MYFILLLELVLVLLFVFVLGFVVVGGLFLGCYDVYFRFVFILIFKFNLLFLFDC